MKVLIVCSYYPPHLGGLELVAYKHAHLLANRSHKVTVLTSSVASDEVSTHIDGVNLVRVKALNLFEKKWGVPFPIFSWRFIRTAFLLTKQTDVVHIHDVFYMSSFFAMVAARFYKKPVILMQHVEMIKHPSRLVMFAQKLVFATTGAYILKHASKIITLNDRVDLFLLERGVKQEKLVPLANGVDTTLFVPVDRAKKTLLRQKLGLSTDKKILLFVGRFVPKKGFDKLLAIKSSEYQIVFAGGEGPVDSEGKTIFLGKMSQSDLVQVYQAADIFVLPSEGEGFPLSVQEAMSSGLPIVMSNDSGYSRYNFNKNKLLLLDDTTPATLSKAILSIYNNESLLQEMSLYSRSYVLENFSWDFVVLELEHLYKTVIS